MLPFLGESFGNAGSVHTPGQRARAAGHSRRPIGRRVPAMSGT